MKKIILLLFCFVSFQAQAQWTQISTIPTTQLNVVKFFDAFTGIAVGVGGIWRSTNSGLNWTQILATGNFNSVSFPDVNNGWAVGDSGKIFRTFDNGQSWATQVSGISDNLYSVSFYNSATGHAVGQNGKILRTITGGTNWYQNANPMSENLNCVQMILNSLTAIAVGGVNHELFVSTANGGGTWVYSLNIPNNHLQSVYSIPPDQGNIEAVGSGGTILRTTNYGSSWTPISSGTTQDLNSVLFIDATTGYIAGNTGITLKTTNSGINWVVFSITGTNLNSLSFINGVTGWSVGQNGVVFRTGIPLKIQQINSETPKKFKLYQNYPNPFNPSTRIRFDINKNNVHVSLNVYNSLGRKVQALVDENLNMGSYEIEWIAENYSTGIYVYQFKTDYGDYYKKMILIK